MKKRSFQLLTICIALNHESITYFLFLQCLHYLSSEIAAQNSIYDVQRYYKKGKKIFKLFIGKVALKVF
jgi:hypothetical protein